MILTTSDIESLSRSLSHWEWGEYISEAFVIIACAGEIVADLDRPWLTDARKKHIQRRSTILLVAALSVALVFLIRTNELSGNVIGFLGQKAEEAGGKAREAVTDASTALSLGKDALGKATAAQQSLSKAENEANQAQTAASSALTLARGARQEADSFEKDIASAKEKLADRTLTDARVKLIASKLKQYAGQEYNVTAYWESKESLGFAARINEALQLANWKIVDTDQWRGLMGGVIGVFVGYHPEADERTQQAAKALVTALSLEGIEAEQQVENAKNNPKHNKITVSVGSKR
jgi:hypothetical protein